MVTLLVGEAEVPFHVHMDILCRASPVFKSAFMGEFAEASERSMTLPEDESDAFENLIQWLYFKDIRLDTAAANGSSEEAEELYMNLVTLYVTSDKYDIPELKNRVIDQLYKSWSRFGSRVPYKSVIGYIYENTTPKSPLRRLLADRWVWGTKLEAYSWPGTVALLRTLPSDFAIDLAIAMAARANGGENSLRRGKTGSFMYHETKIQKAACGKGIDTDNRENVGASDNEDSTLLDCFGFYIEAIT